jgi:hypothetical protein
MRLTPINDAEAIFEPFWDPQLSGLKEWTVEPGAGHGLHVTQSWCWVSFEWARKPPHGPALRMWRDMDLDCSQYDRLMVSVMAPSQSVFRMTAQTDLGERVIEAPPAGPVKKEYLLDLQGARRIRRITLDVEAAEEGIASGWFNWIGLQNSTALGRYLARWNRFDAHWDGYLQPESYEPSFEPAIGILVDKDELASLRERHDEFIRQHGESPFTRAAEAARQLVPERMIRDFVNFWSDTRYCRERDYGNHLVTHGPGAALAGLLLRDKALLRLGARYALSLAMCGRWDDGMICYFPGGTFDHRCFVQSLCVHDTALLLDLAGEMFTPLGRDLLLRRIAEEGLGAIHYNTWRYEYIFHCNQLAWFTPGRMLGCVVLERTWPRVQPYTEMAFRDLLESLDYAILLDGGYVEGPTYFTCVGKSGGLGLYYYARGRRRDFIHLIPDCMKRTAGFGAAVASTDEEKDVIPICDSGDRLDHDETLPVMAAALPQSQWVRMYRKAVNRQGGVPNTVLGWKLDAEIPRTAPDPPPFVFLSAMGVMASTRRLEDQWVKILVMGNKSGAGHTHEDKGSFVLEFAGETFAIDPGSCNYGSPLAGILKNCERHNMLVPFGMVDRPGPLNPLPFDVKPVGQGDAIRFHASIDAAAGWAGFYRRWVRTWDSPRPDVLEIRDEYDLEQGSGVEFYWQTRQDVEVLDRKVVLIGKRGRIELDIPEACAARVDELPLLDGRTQRRVVFRSEGRQGVLDVRVRLVPGRGAAT